MKRRKEINKSDEKPIDVDQEAAKILKIVNGKGWALYYRGPPEAKISVEETFEKGPVSSLEKGIFYLLQPKVDKPTDRNEVRRFIDTHDITADTPKLRVPLSGFDNYGREIHEFEERGRKERLEEEHDLNPGQEISFIGIELQDREIRIISRHVTFMPYDVFQLALLVLMNISKTK